MQDLSQLEVFVRVVDEASFTSAAESLGVSKSFASRQVSALEDRLGARLLNRTTRKVTLTDVGRVFHERCTRILEELQDAEAAVSQLQNAPRGTLRLSAPMSFGVRYVAPIVAEFMVAHAELAVDVHFNDRRVDLIEEGFDLAIRIGKLADSSLIARKVASTELVLVASPGYLAAHGTPESPEDLRGHSCLLYAYQSSGHQTWALDGPSETQSVVHVHGRAVINNGEALLEATRWGLGVCSMPDFLAADDLLSGTLVRVLPDWGSASAVWAIYPHTRHLSAKVRLFVEALNTALEHPPWSRTDGRSKHR